MRLLLDAADRRTRKRPINIVNLGEVFYLSVKAKDLAYGEWVIASLRPRVTTVSADDKLVMNAAALKAQSAISYADAFAVSTAIVCAAPLVTGDRELRAMAHNHPMLKLEWIAG